MRHIKLFLFLAALILIPTGLLLFFKQQEKITINVIDTKSALAEAEGLVMHEFNEKNGYTFLMQAQHVKIPQGNTKTKTHNPICHNTTITVSKNNQTTATLNIALAHVNRELKIIFCSKRITGHVNNFSFLTSSCNYNFSTHVIEVPCMLELTNKKMRTIAPQATIDLQKGTFLCTKGIKTELVLSSKRSGSNNSGK